MIGSDLDVTRAGDSGRPQACGGAGAGGGLAPAAGGPPRRARGAEGRPPLPPDEVAARGRCRRWPWPPSGMTGGSPGWVPPPSCPVEGWDPAPSKRAPNHPGGGGRVCHPLEGYFFFGRIAPQIECSWQKSCHKMPESQFIAGLGGAKFWALCFARLGMSVIWPSHS